jgi:hypothetical protein
MDDATKKKECGERLYEGGRLKAICTQECFTEHSHSDYTASEAITAGVARKRRLRIVDVDENPIK